MNLGMGLADVFPSKNKNYNGEPLIEQVYVIFRITENNEKDIIYRWNSSFTEKWRKRDMDENVEKGRQIMKAIKNDPSMLERGEISYTIEPSAVIVGDQYENDCKVLKQH